MTLILLFYVAILGMGVVSLYYIYYVDKKIKEMQKKPPDDLDDELGSEMNQIIEWVERGEKD